jgi:hypothetical protein
MPAALDGTDDGLAPTQLTERTHAANDASCASHMPPLAFDTACAASQLNRQPVDVC